MLTSLRLCVASLGLLLAGLPAQAAFHLFQINELYSSADGTVQFIELTALSGGQQFVTGHSIAESSGATTHSYVIPTNLPGDTAGRKFLIGTEGFAALGVVTPDYVVPNGFLFIAGGTVNWAETSDVWTHGALPTDGTLSLNRDGSTSVNSPTNFAGTTGQVIPASSTTANLGVTQTASPGTGNVGKDVIFTITVTNAGPASASNVTLTDTLPPGATYVWVSLECGVAGFTATCPLGTLASGASAQRKLVVRPTSAGTTTNNVAVSATEVDPAPSNNTHSLDVAVDTTPAGVLVLRYRLYSDVTKEHHFTTDLNEYTVLGGNGVWVQEGTVGQVLNNPGSFNGVAAVPYYRLYDTSTRWHHWTTDANEYYTLAQYPWWNAEGVDGYILPTNTAGATELFRLTYPFLPGLHHWTIDANEYNTLIASFGWIGEPGAGFVIP